MNKEEHDAIIHICNNIRMWVDDLKEYAKKQYKE